MHAIPRTEKEVLAMPALMIAITNQKGGVGKTTTAAALLASLHNRGARVLGVDLDPQGSLGFSMGLNIERCATIHDVFRGELEPQQAISHTQTCDLLPSNILLAGAELEFNRPGREYMLKTALSKVEENYDYIIVDTPPALNLLTVNAYVAVDNEASLALFESCGFTRKVELRDWLCYERAYKNVYLLQCFATSYV